MSFDFYKRAAIVCRAIPYGKAARRMRVRWDMR